MDFRFLNEKDLQNHLAKGLRTKDKTLLTSVVREYRRRVVKIQPKLFGWLSREHPEIAKERHHFGPDE